MPTTTSGGAEIWYDSVGEGDDVVFIHAGIADSRMWDPQFSSPPDGYRFLRLDLQGFGRTPFAGAPYSNHEDVRAVLDEAGVDDAVVVGCSMGAEVAIDLALGYPDRVGALVLIGSWSPGFDGPEEVYEPPQWAEVASAFREGDLDRAAELETEIWVVGVGRNREDVDPGMFELVRTMDRHALETEKHREEAAVPLDPPAADRMDQSRIPIRVIVGEHDLPDMIAAAEHLGGRMGTEPLIVAGAAHLPSLEQPGEFDRYLLEFLAKIDS